MLGDSHGSDMYGAIASSSGKPFVFGLSQAGCRLHTVDKDCPFDDFKAFVAQNSNALDAVIYTQAGFYLVEDARGVPGTRDFFKLRSVPVYAPNATFIDSIVTYLKGLRDETRVVWLGPRVEPHLNAFKLKKLAMDCEISRIDVQDTIERTFEKMDDFIKSKVTDDTGITYVSTIDAVAFDESTDLYDCNTVYWSDGDHWTGSGEVRFGKRISAALAARGLL